MIPQTVILLLALALVQSDKFPPNWKKCPKVGNEECLKEAVTQAIGDLNEGKKEVNILPIDPFRFNTLVLSQGSSSPVNINLTFYETDILGISRTKIVKAKADWDKCRVSATADVQNGPLKLVGDYTIAGKVLILPISGKGKADITLENFSADVDITGKQVTRNKKAYCDIDDFKVNIRSTKVHFHFENLFNGDKALGDNMNNFLNENWREILNELQDSIRAGLGAGFKVVTKAFFKKVPLNDIYTA